MRFCICFILPLVLILSCKSNDDSISTPLEAGLVAYYPFNGNTNDESGNSNHGQNFGGIIVQDKFGSNSSAIEFNGSSNMDISSTSLLLPIYSYSMWVKPYPTTSQGSYILSIGGVAADQAIGFNNGSEGISRVSVGSYLTGALTEKGWTPSVGAEHIALINYNEWHHIVAVSDGADLTLYLNGVQVGTTSLNGESPKYNETIAKIGSRYNNDLRFEGVMDDIRIYDRALSPSEVSDLNKL